MKKEQNKLFLKVFVILLITLGGCKKQQPSTTLEEKTHKPSTLSQANAALQLSSGTIIGVHKANDYFKIDEVAAAGLKSLEVDIHVGLRNNVPTLLIGHEAANPTWQTLDEYFAFLNQTIPDFEHLWLDCKDLNATYEQLFLDELTKIHNLYGIKSRVLVESQYIQYLKKFKQQGWIVSYYSPWSQVSGGTATQQQAAMQAMYNDMTTHGIDGISYDASVNTQMKNFFTTKSVGGAPVKMYAWDLYRNFSETDLPTKLAQYSNLDVLLISFTSAMPGTGKEYKLVSAVNNTSVLDVTSSSPVNGTTIVLYGQNNPTTSNQVWKLNYLGNGLFSLQTKANYNKVLTVPGNTTANSTQLVVSDYSNVTGQKWKMHYAGNGYYNLEPVCAPGKHLDVSGGATTNSTPIIIYSAHTFNAQKIKFVKQ